MEIILPETDNKQEEYDKILAEIEADQAGERNLIKRLFNDPYAALYSFMKNNPEFISEGVGFLAQSPNQDHLSYIEDLIAENTADDLPLHERHRTVYSVGKKSSMKPPCAISVI